MANKKQEKLEALVSKEHLAEMIEFVGATAAISQLQTMAESQIVAEEDVARLELELKKAKDKVTDISEREIPELMGSLGVAEFKTTTGLFIVLKETIRASIPKDKQPEAFAWLRDNDHAALITRVVSVSFGRGEDEQAAKLLTELQQKKLEPADKTGVNANTLAAFVREQLRDGKDIPLETFGVHRQVASKITFPQPKGK